MKRTRSDDIIYHQDGLAWLNTIRLHLEEIGAIFLFVRCRHAGTGHLALLPNGYEGAVESQGEGGTEQKAAGIESDEDIGYGSEGLPYLQLEDLEQRIKGLGVLEDGQDVDEVYTGDGEVRESAQGGQDAFLGLFAVRRRGGYRLTGELGGTGGGGGGLSSRGIVKSRRGGSWLMRICCHGIYCAVGGDRSTHYEEEREEREGRLRQRARPIMCISEKNFFLSLGGGSTRFRRGVERGRPRLGTVSDRAIQDFF